TFSTDTHDSFLPYIFSTRQCLRRRLCDNVVAGFSPRSTPRLLFAILIPLHLTKLFGVCLLHPLVVVRHFLLTLLQRPLLTFDLFLICFLNRFFRRREFRRLDLR